MDIIQDNYIDEEEARNFLQNLYSGIELLPGVPEKPTTQEAAAVLNVSIPTVERMLSEGMLKLTKQNLIDLVMKNMLAEKPIEEEQNNMNTQGREMTPEELADHQKAFTNIDDCIKELYNDEEDDQQNLFSEEDLRQE